MTDLQLLKDSMDVLERLDCQFLPCDGPRPRIISYVTCIRCATLGKLYKRFGITVERVTNRFGDTYWQRKEA